MPLKCDLQHMLKIKFRSTALRWMPQNSFEISHFGSSNGLLLSGNKPPLEPMLTQIYVTIGHNEFTMGVIIMGGSVPPTQVVSWYLGET